MGSSPSLILMLSPLFLFLYLPWPWPVSAPSPFLTPGSLLSLSLSFSVSWRSPQERGQAQSSGSGPLLAQSLSTTLIFTLLPALLPLSGQSHLALCPGTASTLEGPLTSPPPPVSAAPAPPHQPTSWAVGRPQSQDTCPGPRQGPLPGFSSTQPGPTLSLKIPGDLGKAPPLGGFASSPPPGWEPDPRSEQESALRGPMEVLRAELRSNQQ